jgi:hypothetical protein
MANPTWAPTKDAPIAMVTGTATVATHSQQKKANGPIKMVTDGVTMKPLALTNQTIGQPIQLEMLAKLK